MARYEPSDWRYHWPGQAVSRFQPDEAVVAELHAKFGENVTCRWCPEMERLAIYTRQTRESPWVIRHPIVDPENNDAPRQVTRWDVMEMEKECLDSPAFRDPLKHVKEQEKRRREAAFAHLEEVADRTAKQLANWGKRTVVDLTARRGNTHRAWVGQQPICPHSRREVSCPLCNPRTKMRFLMGRPSGSETNGYVPVDVRDVGMGTRRGT